MDHHQSDLHSVAMAALIVLLGFLPAGRAHAQSTDVATSEERSLWANEFALWADRPKALTVQVGVPNPLSFTGTIAHGFGVRSQTTLGVSPIPLGGANLFLATCLEEQLAWHPNWKEQGPLFFATGLGFQSLHFATRVQLGSIASDLNSPTGWIGWQNIYWTATVGWLWLRSHGFFVGFDLSVRVPIVGWGGITVTGGAASDMANDLSASSAYSFSRFAQLVYPSLTLIRLGWVF